MHSVAKIHRGDSIDVENSDQGIDVDNRDYHYQSQNATVLGLLVISGFLNIYRGTQSRRRHTHWASVAR